MKETRIMMNMPITVEISDLVFPAGVVEAVFSYFDQIEQRFSVYKTNSEISKINKGVIKSEDYSNEMKEVLRLCQETKIATHGFFDIEWYRGHIDPAGLVKGWAIYNAAEILKKNDCHNFYVEAGGDIQVYGYNSSGQDWRVGICNPFQPEEIIKTVALRDRGMATSGTYLRGQHIYNPHEKEKPILEIVSLSIIGPTVYEADRFATAAFAMGKAGIKFIEAQAGMEGYMVDSGGIATMTSGFNQYVVI